MIDDAKGSRRFRWFVWRRPEYPKAQEIFSVPPVALSKAKSQRPKTHTSPLEWKVFHLVDQNLNRYTKVDKIGAKMYLQLIVNSSKWSQGEPTKIKVQCLVKIEIFCPKWPSVQRCDLFWTTHFTVVMVRNHAMGLLCEKMVKELTKLWFFLFFNFFQSFLFQLK